jgi:hypothetical protein
MYYFKNKDVVLAKLDRIGDCFKLVDIYCNLSTPILFMLKSDDNLNTWIDNRQPPYSRPYVSDLLKQAGIKSRVDYVDVSLCLSLTDTFWITSNYTQLWESVSLFSNSFTKVYTDIVSGVRGFNGRIMKSPSPELGVDGNSKKCFKRINNSICLYKTFGGLAELEYSGVYSEFLATQFLNALGLNHNKYVSYTVCQYNNSIWSRCNLFTNEHIGLLPIECVFDDFEHLEEHIEHYSGNYLLEYKLLMVLDAVLLNVDRHGENIALLYNTDTFEFLGFSPIYDFDHSLFYDISLLNRSKGYITERVFTKFPRTYFGHYFKDQFNYCITNQVYSRLSELYNSNFKFINSKSFPMNETRLDMINKVFRWWTKGLMG